MSRPFSQLNGNNAGGNRMSMGRKSLAPSSRRESSIGGPALRRQSVAPNSRRATIAGNNRNSMASAGTRRKSVMPQPSQGRRSTKDPRPLTERDFIKESSRKVIGFLAKYEFEVETGIVLTIKTLQRPASKIYASVVEFIYKRVEPNFTIDGKVEVEVPELFKRLGYHFNIQKSALQSITQHNWPPLLGALVWLIDSIEYDEAIAEEQNRRLVAAEDDAGEQQFFSYLEQSYHLFLEGADDCPELDEVHRALFEAKNKQLVIDIKMLSGEVSELDREVARLEAASEVLPKLKLAKQDRELDVLKFSDLISQFGGYIEEVKRKVSANEKEKLAREQRLSALQIERDSAQCRLKEQEDSETDFRAMVDEKALLTDELRELRGTREVSQRRKGEQEIQLNRHLEVLETELKQYSELALKLRLVPSGSSTLAQGQDYDVKFRFHAPPDRMTSISIRNEILPGLKNIKASLSEHLLSGQDQVLALQEQIDALQDQLEIKRDDVESRQDKIKSLESECVAIRDGIEEDQRQEKLRIFGIREEALLKLERSQNALHQSQTALDSLREEENRLRKRFLEEGDQLNNSVIVVVEMLTNHKQYIQLRLRELQDMGSEVTRALRRDDGNNTTLNFSRME